MQQLAQRHFLMSLQYSLLKGCSSTHLSLTQPLYTSASYILAPRLSINRTPSPLSVTPPLAPTGTPTPRSHFTDTGALSVSHYLALTITRLIAIFRGKQTLKTQGPWNTPNT